MKLVLVSAAIAAAIAQASPSKPMLQQGVQGHVVKKEGNFMPGVVGQPHSGGKTTALSVPVHVYRGAIKPATKFDRKHPALVTSTKSDAKGDYRVALPAGQYTVVAEIDGNLHLNAFDGAGNWSTINVQPGSFATWNIADTSNAAW